MIMGKTKEFLFENGDSVIEKVTGFKGTITGTAFYLTGCSQYLVTAKPTDQFSAPIAIWYDEGRLMLEKEQVVSISDVSAKENGCDRLPDIGIKGN